jgi:membrane complex biogenesis BtpA family protein
MKFKIIGVVHLLPLPGSPFYSGNLKEVLKRAQEDTKKLAEQGIRSLIIENFGDSPFLKYRLKKETLSAFTSIAKELVESYPDIEFSINALRNAGYDAMAIAFATGSRFIRINIPIGQAITPEGIIEGRIREVIELRERLKAKVKLFEDVFVKHAWFSQAIPFEEMVKETIERGFADAIIITGRATGLAAPPEAVKRAKEVSTVPVFVGSGVTPENLAYFVEVCDGAIVGTYFKKDGKTTNPVDPKRVKTFIETLNRLGTI